MFDLQKVVFPLQPPTFGLTVYLIPIRRKSYININLLEKTPFHRCGLEVAGSLRVMGTCLFGKSSLQVNDWRGILGWDTGQEEGD